MAAGHLTRIRQPDGPRGSGDEPRAILIVIVP